MSFKFRNYAGLLAALTVVAVAACSGGPEIPPEQMVKITVQNNFNPARSFTVSIQARGTNQILGSVRPGQTTSFDWGQSSYEGTSFRLSVQPAGTTTGMDQARVAAATTSQAFRLFAGAEVMWQLRNNRLVVKQPSEN